MEQRVLLADSSAAVGLFDAMPAGSQQPLEGQACGAAAQAVGSSVGALGGHRVSAMGIDPPPPPIIVKPPIPTQMSLQTSAATAFLGQIVTFTAQASSGSIQSYGSVTFTLDGRWVLGKVTITDEKAVLSTSSLPLGDHVIEATASNGTYTLYASVINQSIIQGPFQVWVKSSADTVTVGNVVYLSTYFTGKPANEPVDDGTVTFLDGSTVLGTATVSYGEAYFSTTALAVGDHAITARHSGKFACNAATTAAFIQHITPQPTQVSLLSSADTVTVGKTVALTASITGRARGGQAFGGTVTFSDGGTVLGTATVNNGQAVFSTAALTVGDHAITARYSGDAVYAAATSPAITQHVTPRVTQVCLLSSASAVTVGQTLTFRAVLTGRTPSGQLPGGTVTFADGSTVLGTAAASNGQAVFSTAALAVGDHAITARYSGDAAFAAVTSAAMTQSVVSSTVLDLLVLYTPAAYSAAGGSDSAARAKIAAEVDRTNQAFINSKINVTLRLVHVEEAVYIESGDYSTDLNRLSTNGDRFLDQAQTLRNQYGADLVSLFVGSAAGGMAGLGNTLTIAAGKAMWAYSVVLISQEYTLAHELGHNLGAVHDLEHASGDGATAYSYGYRFRGNDGVIYHDIMSYDPGQEIPYYSNPDITYKGVPEGTQSTFNVARTINTTAPNVANYRASVVPRAAATQTSVSIAGTVASSSTVTITAEVNDLSASPDLPGGNVTFIDGGTVLGIGTLNSGTAVWTGTLPASDVHAIRAFYQGEGYFGGSLSAFGPLVVNGTAGNDKIALTLASGKIRVTMNGVSRDYEPATTTGVSIYGGDGNDTITVDAAVTTGVYIDGAAGNDSITGGSGADLIYGGAGNDTLVGGAGNDTMYGNGGDDVLLGQTGDDVLYGSAGNDMVQGNAGNDSLSGDSGNDTLRGGAGNDTIYGGAGNDQVYGEVGDDWMYLKDVPASAVPDTVYGGTGTNHVLHDANDLIYDGHVDLLA